MKNHPAAIRIDGCSETDSSERHGMRTPGTVVNHGRLIEATSCSVPCLTRTIESPCWVAGIWN